MRSVIKDYRLWLCVFVAFVITRTILPIYPNHSDIGRCLFIAKHDSQNLLGIAFPSGSIINNIKIFGLDYYRPLTRFVFALLFKYWGTNFTALYLLESLLFAAILAGIYIIGLLLENRWTAFLSIAFFLFTKDIYHDLTVLSYLNALLATFIYLLAIIFITVALRKGERVYLLFGILFAILSSQAKEIAYYLIPTYSVCLILFYRNIKPAVEITRILFVSIAILLFLFIISPFLHYLAIKPAGFVSGDMPYAMLAWPNFKAYAKIIVENLGLGGIILVAMAFLNTQRNIIYIFWATVVFLPPLFYPIVARPYLFDMYIPLSLIAGKGMYQLLRIAKSYSRKHFLFSLKNLFLVFAMIILLGYRFIDTALNRIWTLYKWRRIQFGAQKQLIDTLIKETSKGATVLVPYSAEVHPLLYYSYMANIFDRNDLKLIELNEINFEQLSEKDNLLSDYDFRKGLEKWKSIHKDCIRFIADETDPSVRIVKLTDDYEQYSSDGSEVFQEVPLEPGASYVFGAWMKTNALKNKEARARIELWDSRGWDKAVWHTKDVYGSSEWSLVFTGFENTKFTKSVRFICLRILDFKGGEVLVKRPFLRRLKYKYIAHY